MRSAIRASTISKIPFAALKTSNPRGETIFSLVARSAASRSKCLTATEKAFRRDPVEPTLHRDSRVFSTACVAYRPGVRACAVWADVNASKFGDRPKRCSRRRRRSRLPRQPAVGPETLVRTVPAKRGLPSITKPTSKLVPPISVAMRFRQRESSPVLAACITPPTGPEAKILTGLAGTSSSQITPPFDCITKSEREKPLEAKAPLIASFSARLPDPDRR